MFFFLHERTEKESMQEIPLYFLMILQMILDNVSNHMLDFTYTEHLYIELFGWNIFLQVLTTLYRLKWKNVSITLHIAGHKWKKCNVKWRKSFFHH